VPDHVQAQSGDLRGSVFGSVGLEGLILEALDGAQSLLVVRHHSLTPSDQSGQNVTSCAKRELRPRQHALPTTPSTKSCAPWRDQRICHRFLALMRGRRTNSDLTLARGPLQTRKRFKSRALVTNSDSAAHRYRHSTRPSFFSWSTRPEQDRGVHRATRNAKSCWISSTSF
jgi:hypothetical protein